MHFKEGIVVNCVSKIKVEEQELRQGTIWMISRDLIHVLDSQGYIHACNKFNEVFNYENS